MNKSGRMFAWLAITLGLLGCASQPPTKPRPFKPEMIAPGGWKQKADHLVFVLDASSSMLEGHGGAEKFTLARNAVANFNQTMPELKIQAALRSFGHDPAVSPASTISLYGPADYSRSGMASGLARLNQAGGPSPLDRALLKAAADLKDAAGTIALVIVSDGKDMGPGVLAAAEAMKNQFKERVCIHTVQVGTDPAGQALLSKLAALTGCGGTLNVDDVGTPAGMADFVKKVLLTEETDSDRDGVADSRDRCPGTPQGVRVDQNGCPPPQAAPPPPPPVAPKAAIVTAEGTWIFKGVQFETNSAELKPVSIPVLNEIVAGLKEQPNLRVEIQGHTDNRGSKQLNDRLSQRRAESVRNYLLSKGIAADRLTAKGFGMHKPIASNDTVEGRAENRRVELKPLL